MYRAVKLLSRVIVYRMVNLWTRAITHRAVNLWTEGRQIETVRAMEWDSKSDVKFLSER